MWLGVDRQSLYSGPYGYNGILVGAVLTTFLASTPLLWVYLIFGAAVSMVIMLAISNVLKTWGLSALTAPFVLTTIILLLATYNSPNLGISRLPHAALHDWSRPPGPPFRLAAFFPSVFTGVAQVFLVQNVATGVIFLLALAVSSVRAAAFALAASMVAVAVASQLGADSTLITAGLFGFSPAIAVGTVFNWPGLRVGLYAFIATVFAVLVQAALNVFVEPLGIPTLTAPFVLATWLFLLPIENFAQCQTQKLLEALYESEGRKFASKLPITPVLSQQLRCELRR
jgi:urea transporter